jgi:hypothetical protein
VRKSNGPWQFPQAAHGAGETVRQVRCSTTAIGKSRGLQLRSLAADGLLLAVGQVAERALSQAAGGLDVYFMGNAPVAHQALPDTTLFFLRASYLGGGLQPAERSGVTGAARSGCRKCQSVPVLDACVMLMRPVPLFLRFRLGVDHQGGGAILFGAGAACRLGAGAVRRATLVAMCETAARQQIANRSLHVVCSLQQAVCPRICGVHAQWCAWALGADCRRGGRRTEQVRRSPGLCDTPHARDERGKSRGRAG